MKAEERKTNTKNNNNIVVFFFPEETETAAESSQAFTSQKSHTKTAEPSGFVGSELE